MNQLERCSDGVHLRKLTAWKLHMMVVGFVFLGQPVWFEEQNLDSGNNAMHGNFGGRFPDNSVVIASGRDAPQEITLKSHGFAENQSLIPDSSLRHSCVFQEMPRAKKTFNSRKNMCFFFPTLRILGMSAGVLKPPCFFFHPKKNTTKTCETNCGHLSC